MELSVNGQKFAMELMRTPEEIEKGMMGRTELDGCMGFKLKKGYHTFWMKNCLIPLDIVFVLNGKVNKIFNDCQPCAEENCQKFTSAADHVFEFPAGVATDFKEGDFVNLYLGTKFNPI
jgi:uncharacterized membrane protein (UPF0127 family)